MAREEEANTGAIPDIFLDLVYGSSQTTDRHENETRTSKNAITQSRIKVHHKKRKGRPSGRSTKKQFASTKQSATMAPTVPDLPYCPRTDDESDSEFFDLDSQGDMESNVEADQGNKVSSLYSFCDVPKYEVERAKDIFVHGNPFTKVNTAVSKNSRVKKKESKINVNKSIEGTDKIVHCSIDVAAIVFQLTKRPLHQVWLYQ
jgi:hypothetical protein